MRFSFSIDPASIVALVALLATTGGVSAKPPKQARVSQYSRLWTASPFTIKPTAKVAAAASPLERDWSLGSIVPLENGYAVTLINKKNRKERVRFLPGFSAGDFKLLEVKQNTTDRKESRVLVSKGGQKGWISYDQKVIALKTAKIPKGRTSKRPVTQAKSRHSSPPIPGKSGASKHKRTRYVPRTK